MGIAMLKRDQQGFAMRRCDIVELLRAGDVFAEGRVDLGKQGGHGPD
jgi:hypothetical protein